MEKINFIEINYHCHQGMTDPIEVIKKHLPSNLFAKSFSQYANVFLVKHMNFDGVIDSDGLHYYFQKRANRFLQIPFSTHQWVSDRRPDLILIQGFIFPLQVLALRKKLGKHAVILLQHHGEIPGGKKIFFQKLADRQVDGYLFSASGNSLPWLKSGIISSPSKCYELPSSSTLFSKQDKNKCRSLTGMNGGINFLWVGRLNANKDPLTVLKGFKNYLNKGGKGKLWMIYSEADMLEEIKLVIARSPLLKASVTLVGKIPYTQMESWYTTADYFISGSRQEGGSYALTEAMACGCIPVITSIPPAMKSIKDGEYGYFYEPGNAEQLGEILKNIDTKETSLFSDKIIQYFKTELSGGAVAEKLFKIYNNIKIQRPG